MNSRQAVGYVVQVEGVDVTLNMLDMHRGHLAAHSNGVSTVTEIGSLLGLEAGGRLLVMKVLSLRFAEPKEAHRKESISKQNQDEPLRHVSGVVVGRICRDGENIHFVSDSLATPPLGAEAYPLTSKELSTILEDVDSSIAPIHLGNDLRGGGQLKVSLESLISRHVAVLGSSGQGKSCFTAAILQQIVKFEKSRIIIFDINGEYEDAFKNLGLPDRAVKVSRLGGSDSNSIKIPYYALGRQGLQRLLIPSERTQRPALSFAVDNLNKVKWFQDQGGAGLCNASSASLFDDCRAGDASEANNCIDELRANKATVAKGWPSMRALGALVAESHSITKNNRGTLERNAFSYGNISPLVTRIHRFVEDPMFCDVVDVDASKNDTESELCWKKESTKLVDSIFGGQSVDWRVHIIDLRRVSHDLTPFVLGALLELYAYELFKRGQDNKISTLLVLEEAHHYLRSIGSGEEAASNSLAYERLAKEGRKFGLALWLSTQRPSEISPTVLSQCNNWVSFRLTSEKDLAAVQAASEWADRREVKRIAGLARQNAMIFGGSLKMPTLICAPTADPLPRSEDGKFNDWNTTTSASTGFPLPAPVIQ